MIGVFQCLAIDTIQTEPALVKVDHDVAFTVHAYGRRTASGLRGFERAEEVARVGVNQDGAIYLRGSIAIAILYSN